MINKIKNTNMSYTLDWDQAYDLFEKLGDVNKMEELLNLNYVEKQSFTMNISIDIEILEH